MRSTLRRAVGTWLTRELADAPDAESALAAVFRRWPGAMPPAGFAEAVLRAAGLAGTGADWLPAWALRGAFGVGLLLAVPALGHAVGLLLELGRSGQLAALGVQSVVWVGQGAAAVGTLLAALLDAAQPLSAALRGPGVLGFCLAAALVALAAFWRLQFLLTVDRSPHHA